jgi:excisionase family DNA binding protein
MNIQNPFAILEAKLANIEGLLIDLKHPEESVKTNKSKSILDTDQLMAKLGVTRPTLSKWRKENRIPFIQVGAVVRYDLDKVLEALESKKRRSR